MVNDAFSLLMAPIRSAALRGLLYMGGIHSGAEQRTTSSLHPKEEDTHRERWLSRRRSVGRRRCRCQCKGAGCCTRPCSWCFSWSECECFRIHYLLPFLNQSPASFPDAPMSMSTTCRSGRSTDAVTAILSQIGRMVC
jgi:hypothetical protein